MKVYTSDKKITIGFFGHMSSGKTSFAETMFFNAGLINRMGKTQEKNTVLDFEVEEQNRGQSINLSMGYVEHMDKKIQIVDAPGFLDFQGEIISGLFAADIAALFINPASAIEVGLEKSLELAEDRDKPVIFIINGIDRENSEWQKAFKDIESYSTIGIAPLTIPIGEKGDFKGIINLLTMKAHMYKDASGKPEITDIPAEHKDIAESFREKMIEAIAESSDELTEKYLETMELDEKDIATGLKLGLAAGKFRPLFVSSAVKNGGVDAFMDIVSAYFPKYSDFKPAGLLKGEEQVELARNEASPFTAYVFKTLSDAHLGDVVTTKVITGKVAAGTDFYNLNKEKAEKSGQLYVLLGDKKDTIDEASAGDIVSFVKLKVTETMDSICGKAAQLQVPGIEFPEPIYSLAIQPKSKDDQEKVSIALNKISKEDPSFKSYMDKEFGDFIISGMGDTHVSMILEKIKRKFGVEVDTANPQVPYRETITASAEAQGRYKKQSGGRGQFGDTWIKLEPCSEGFEFVNAVVGGSIPKNFIPSVEKGVKGAMEKGALAGYPVVNVKVILYDGSYHTVDSSDMAFQVAGSMGFKNACEKAKMILLEPIYDFFITSPEENQGDIMGDLSGRRGKIQGTEQKKGGKVVISARVPLAEMFTYINILKSMTGGRGFYSMKFSHYEAVPSNLSQKIVKEREELFNKE